MISIIVPIYNKENYLEKCLNSIQSQTYADFEVLLVDDGSTDGSLEICRKYEENDKRFHVFPKENGGVASARNFGIEKSAGDYLAFVDPDDYIHPQCMELLKKAINAVGAEISYCDAMDVKASTGKMRTRSMETGSVNVVPKEKYDWFDPKSHNTSWGALYKKSVTSGIWFDSDLKIGEDTLFLAKCIHEAHNIVCVDRALYYYYINDDSVTSGRYTERKLDELEAWRRVCKTFEDVPFVYESAKAAYAIRCRFMAIRYCKDKEFMRHSCADVGRQFRRVASTLLKRWKNEGKWSVYLKTLFSFYCWDIWIKLKQTRKTYEVEL